MSSLVLTRVMALDERGSMTDVPFPHGHFVEEFVCESALGDQPNFAVTEIATEPTIEAMRAKLMAPRSLLNCIAQIKLLHIKPGVLLFCVGADGRVLARLDFAP